MYINEYEIEFYKFESIEASSNNNLIYRIIRKLRMLQSVDLNYVGAYRTSASKHEI